GRRRLHLRFPRTPIIYGAFSQRLRIRNGIPLSRLYRAGFDAASPPISGDAGDDLDTEFSIWQPFLRHSLWNARNHSRCASKNGPSVAVLGIRFGDGSEIGPHGAAHSRSAGSLLKGRAGPFESSQALRLVFTVASGLDQPQSHVRSWRRFFSFSSGTAIAICRSLVDRAGQSRSCHSRPNYVLAALDAFGAGPLRLGPAWNLRRRHRPVVLRLFRRNDTALAKDVLLYAIGCAERRRCCRRRRFRNSIGCPLHPLRFPIVRNFSRRSSRRCWIVIGDRRIYEFHFYLGNPCGRREP